MLALGSNLVHRLFKDMKEPIVGIDNLNNYYDPSLKSTVLRSWIRQACGYKL